jgi:hypothetical protein
MMLTLADAWMMLMLAADAGKALLVQPCGDKKSCPAA